MGEYDFDLVVVGGGPAGAAAAKAAVEGGLRTLLIEKKKLPRHKPCSGVIMPAAVGYIEKYFGAVPDGVLTEQHTWKGSHFHLRKGQVFEMQVTYLNAWRDRLDNWLCSESGAEIWESTRLLDFAEWKDRVQLVLRRGGEEIGLSAPVMVAADGGVSDIAKKLDPTFGKGLGMTYSHQDYRRGSVDLDPSYYHIFLQPGIGLMPTLYFKDDLMVTDTLVFSGEKVGPVREKYSKWLADNHGFKPSESVMTLGCLASAPSSINRFCFGTDRVLVAGEAAGFMNMAFEGISSAIATGYLAGKAAAGCSGRPPGPVYRESVKPERERTAGEWYLPSIITGKAAPLLKECLMAAPAMVRLRAMNELMAWMKGFGIKGSDAVELTIRKLFSRGFDFRA